MKLLSAVHPLAVAIALLAAASTAAAASASRSACTPRPASDGVASQSADGLSLRLDGAHPVALANWDVRWWERHRVWIALQASNPGDAAAQVLPQMLVDAQADGSAPETLSAPPVALAPHASATQRLSIWVPDDARTLGVRVLAVAPVQPVAVSFALECSDARYDAGEVLPTATPLLDEAARAWFGGFVDPQSDPKLPIEALRRLSGGAQESGDVVWAMRGLMQTVRDDHGWIVGPGEPVPARHALATRAPEFELSPDGIAVVRLHAVDPGSDAAAQAWAAALFEGVRGLARQRPVGWIVDLRDHDGGSPWASFAGLSNLLGGPLVGGYVTVRGRQDWIVERGSAGLAGEAPRVDVQASPTPPIDAPVAVLIGPGTRDAGEDVAVALSGRAHTRFLGAPTAGFPTLGVRVHRLSDGTTLGVLEQRDADRNGRVQRLPVEPETLLKAPALQDAVPSEAVAWLLRERAGMGGNR